ncbi:MAG: hypothetical protein MJZ51_02345 [Bacteroidales bacterium]|nr:hypothetical protein [Bacteroidales bacterium]
MSGIGGLKLAGRVSAKSDNSVLGTVPQVQPNKILTQEELDQHWNKIMSSKDERVAEMVGLLKDYHPIIDESGVFTLQMPNSFVEAEFRKHKVRLLELLRKMSGSSELNVKVEIVHAEVKAAAYRPDEKYQAMLESNPDLAKLREIFPIIDY